MHLSFTKTPLDPSSHIGFIKRVRILQLQKGRKHSSSLVFVRTIQSMTFDPDRWTWRNNTNLLAYLTSLGRTLIIQHHHLRRSIPSKCSNHLPSSFTPNWKDLWLKSRSSKKATFMWSTWHNAVAVHSWRVKINLTINMNGKCYDLAVIETLFYKFFDCPRARDAWDYAHSIVYQVRGAQPIGGPHPWLSFLQCIFGMSPLRSFKKFKLLWTLFWGSVLWIIWISRNS